MAAWALLPMLLLAPCNPRCLLNLLHPAPLLAWHTAILQVGPQSPFSAPGHVAAMPCPSFAHCVLVRNNSKPTASIVCFQDIAPKQQSCHYIIKIGALNSIYDVLDTFSSLMWVTAQLMRSCIAATAHTNRETNKHTINQFLMWLQQRCSCNAARDF
jgi:hypothetical protein